MAQWYRRVGFMRMLLRLAPAARGQFEVGRGVWVLLLASLIAVGCSDSEPASVAEADAAQGVGDSRSSDTSGDVGPNDTSPPGDEDTVSADADEDVPSGDTGEPDVPPGPKPVPDSLCPSMGWMDASLVAMVVTTGSEGLHFIHADRSSTVIALPWSPVEEGVEAGNLRAVVRYPYVLVSRDDSEAGPVGKLSAKLAVMDTSGTVLWSIERDGVNINLGHLALDGSASLIESSPSSGSHGLYVSASGELTEIPGYHPWGPPDTHAQVPVRKLADGPPYQWGWFDPSTGDFSVAFEGLSKQVGYRDDSITHVGTGKTAPWMFQVSSQESDFVVLGAIENSDFGSLEIVHINHAWTLIRHGVTGELWRVLNTNGDALAVPSAPPEGWSFLEDCYIDTVVLDGAGFIARPLRNAAESQVWRTDPETGEWTPRGYPITGLNALELKAYIGTYVITTEVSGDNFCPEIDWDPAGVSRDALEGGSLQVVAGGDPVVPSPQEGGLYMHRTGICAAWYTSAPEGPVLKVYDILDGSVTSSPVAGQAVWLN